MCFVFFSCFNPKMVNVWIGLILKYKMTTESPTGISAEFQNHLRSECEYKLNETVFTHPSKLSWLLKVNIFKISANYRL